MLSTIFSEKYDYDSINLYIGKKITYFPHCLSNTNCSYNNTRLKKHLRAWVHLSGM